MELRPTVALLVRAGILPAGEREERCLSNGCGGHLTTAEARQAAEHIDAVVLTMRPDERICSDGTTTTRAIDYAKPLSEWDEDDISQRYSVSRDVLKEFADFCRSSAGLEVL